MTVMAVAQNLRILGAEAIPEVEYDVTVFYKKSSAFNTPRSNHPST